MMNPAFAQLNALLMQAQTASQQGAMAEMQGNLPIAVQCYDYAVQLIYQSIASASSYTLPVPESVHHSYAGAHFNAARAKGQLGWGPLAMQHLQQSLMALNQCVALNPRFGPYHSAAGSVLLALGNTREAETALRTALTLNPADAQAHAMLGLLGGMTPLPHADALAGMSAPPAAQPAPTPAASGGGQTTGQDKDWIETLNRFFTMANNGVEAFNGIQGLFNPGGGNPGGNGNSHPYF